jgi:ketosteroid isomerase-like protein
VKSISGLVKAMQVAAFTKDWGSFTPMFAEDVYYRVGNNAEATDREAVTNYVRDLPTALMKFNRMDVRRSWEAMNAAIVEYDVHGVRVRDNKPVEYPCVDIYRFEGDRFKDWRAYPIEPTFVAADSRVTPRQPGVASQPGAEGAAGLQVLNAFQGALSQGKWDVAGSLLADGVEFRAGNRPEVRGPRAVMEQLGEIFKHIRPSAANFTDVWAFGDALVVEMTVQATRVQDNQRVEYPCVESYRFADGKIQEWRIYPAEPTLLAPGS